MQVDRVLIRGSGVQWQQLYVFGDIDGLSGVIWELLEGRKLKCLRNDGCRVQGSASALAGWLVIDEMSWLTSDGMS